MKPSSLIFALVFVSTSPFIAHAEGTAETSTKIEDVTPNKNVPSGSDIDETITNNRMRAEAGAKSKWSIKSELYYNGGSLQKPLAAVRPNISGGAGSTDVALLTGAVLGKYAMSQSSSLMAGVGVRWITPFQEAPKDYSGKKIDADNPYLVYQHLYKWSGVQSAFQIIPKFYTNTNLTNIGYVTTLEVNQNNVYEIGKSGVSLGLYTFAQTGYYNKNEEEFRAQQSDLTFGLSPFIEYQINDKLNLRTVTNLWIYDHYRNADAHTYTWNKVTQSVGVGYALTRDIFLYPNVQFLPDNVRSDVTNVAINSYINL